jgi:hypothetical protein
MTDTSRPAKSSGKSSNPTGSGSTEAADRPTADYLWRSLKKHTESGLVCHKGEMTDPAGKRS